jgi:8-oxo-dGTP pyrophosphatase MutT (NUDIX family)
VKWTVHGEDLIYDSPWVRLVTVDVELADGTRLDHHVVRAPRPAAGAVVADPDRGVLLIWRHRFITDTWGWEIPAGRVDVGETPVDAAAREVLEETGWRPGPLEPVVAFHPSNGLSDQTFHIFLARGAEPVGAPADPNEAAEVAWKPVAEVRDLIAAGQVRDGLSLAGLGAAFARSLL